MLQRPVRTTLYLYPAAFTPQVLVVRRGPSKWWHFMVWNRDTGDVTHGSWLNGMLYPAACDLSPRGDWMVILAFRGTPEPLAWTALCRTPSVKAVAFWPHETAQHGGGFFDGRSPVLWLHAKASTVEVREQHPFEFGLPEGETPRFGTLRDRLEREGWKPAPGTPTQEFPLHWHRRSPSRQFELLLEFTATPEALTEDPTLYWTGGATYSVRPAISLGKPPVPLTGVTWASWSSKGGLCLAADGALFTTTPENPNERTLVADLKDLAPRTTPLAPPPLPTRGKVRT